MLSQKQVFDIRILHSAGISISQIVKLIGCHPNIVSKFLKKEWSSMAKKPSKLDPFKDHIFQRLQEYPNLSAVVLFEEILRRGYTGKITILRDHLRTIRTKEDTEPFRFETEPGQQFQVDWGQGSTSLLGEKATVKFFVMVLSYSRMIYAEIVPNEKLETLIQAHLNAFSYFGGYPFQGLYDNMKTVVKKLKRQKEFNTRFMDFADFYGIKVITHKPCNPKAKGKVERMVPYVRNNVLYGKEYSSLKEL